MPEDMYGILVNVTDLDNALTATASAIREKTGDSSSINFDLEGGTGFATAVSTIPSGGGYVTNDWFDKTKPTGEIVYNGTTAPPPMCDRTGAFSISMPNVTVLSADYPTFRRCTGMTSLSAPNLTEFKSTWSCAGTTGWIGPAFFPKAIVTGNCFNNSRISALVCFRIANANASACENDTNLQIYDQLSSNNLNGAKTFSGCTSLGTIILRSTSVVSLGNTNNLTNTKFWSGKSGGDIYIPQTLYNALGTGTNDYKAASNWSTIDGYGTITWHAIEGSYYETHYGDGTLIPTS